LFGQPQQQRFVLRERGVGGKLFRGFGEGVAQDADVPVADAACL
jgi:hypothetical protein